jgi:peptidoglycan/LPS O-acetylase OafA/YrhL
VDRNNELNARLIWIEVLRFISAFGIIIWHYQHFYTLENFDRSLQPFYSNPIFHLFYNSGGGGVYLFWCISGYIFFYKYRNLIRMDEGGGGGIIKSFFYIAIFTPLSSSFDYFYFSRFFSAIIFYT